jgi:phosphopantetheinyl transferase (holo-ACP synthase)
MIGNDIVDLQLALIQSNWQRLGFLEKQFTEQEQRIILNSENPFLQVWLFWSMKEAAYKCYTQHYKKRFFAPKKFACNMTSKTTGFIKIDTEVYFSSSRITESYIHTIASKRKQLNVTFNLFFIDKNLNQSSYVNKQLISSFSEANYVMKNEFGVPFLYSKQKKIPVSISTSHHGNYGGFAILKTK